MQPLKEKLLTCVKAAASHLPLSDYIESLSDTLQRNPRLLLEAPPGTGKTTIVPLVLLAQGWVSERRIVVVQPRRLAARGVALRMAEILRESVGGIVGFRTRTETSVSKRTRIEVVTEGILLRELLRDPELANTAAVILDEFHERTVYSEILASFLCEVVDSLRPDLRIILMSATHGASVVERFPDFGEMKISSPLFPVDVIYRPIEVRRRFEDEVARVIVETLHRYPSGDLLVFLPGAREIQRTIELLYQNRLGSVVLFPLYGELPYHEQKRALERDRTAQDRCVVLATNIAETSLTIPGVTVVIDSGYHKIVRFDPNTLLNQLRRERISVDSATQRAGRAGRLCAGTCIRLWSLEEQKALRSEREPEVARVDPADACLTILAWGSSIERFNWTTPPLPSALQSARNQLQRLGFITEEGQLTRDGLLASDLGTSPRLARIAIESVRLGIPERGAEILSFLEAEGTSYRRSERGVNIFSNPLFKSLDETIPHSRGHLSPREWLQRISRLKVEDILAPPDGFEEQVALLLAVGFSERIGVRRASAIHRFQFASGQGGALQPNDPLSASYLIVAPVVRLGTHDVGDAEIVVAAPIRYSLIAKFLPDLLTESTEFIFDDTRGELVGITKTKILQATVRESPAAPVSPEVRIDALIDWLSTPEGFARLPGLNEIQQTINRLEWARAFGGFSELPAVNIDSLRETVKDWLGPFLRHDTTLEDLTPRTILDGIFSLIPWKITQELAEVVPCSVVLPKGRTRPLRYSGTTAPVLEVILQEVLGWMNSPRVGRTKVPIIVELLSPARRPIQRTQDLAAFWAGSYLEVRKELRGRYPKHLWPEDPLRVETG